MAFVDEKPQSAEQILLREANHRIANHLALLASTVQIQTSSLSRGPATLPREAVKQMMQSVASKIVSVGHLHRRLAHANEQGSIDVGDFLIEYAANLIASLSLDERVFVVHKLDTQCRIRPDQAQPLSLLASEIMMNAIKHAHPTGLPVQIHFACMRGADGSLTVEIGDDGVGLPEEFDVELDGGVGFRLIHTLADKLGAKLTIESDSLGLSFRLRFSP